MEIATADARKINRFTRIAPMLSGMWWTCFLDVLRTYQTIAAGLIAFCGVVVALMGNSYIAAIAALESWTPTTSC